MARQDSGSSKKKAQRLGNGFRRNFSEAQASFETLHQGKEVVTVFVVV